MGRLQGALMADNPVHFTVEHISTEKNVVADKISRTESEAALTTSIPLIQQAHPELAGCQRFHLTSSQLSCLMETLLQADCKDPVEASKLLLTDRGRITT